MIKMGEKNETVNINVLIAERTYPLKVLRNDEEKLHGAVKLVNQRIKEYQKLYDGKDKQDYMAMCLLNFAVEFENLQNGLKEEHSMLDDKLTELENVLSDSFK